MISLFRHLRPTLSVVKPLPAPHTQLPPGAPVWCLTFKCPECGYETSIHVGGIKPPVHPVWFMTPHPVVMMERIKAADTENNWDDVTIEPSMKDLAHPRQINCKAHFSVTRGHNIKG